MPVIQRKESIQGEEKYFDRIGTVEVMEKVGRHSNTTFADTPYSRRRISMRDYFWADLVDKEDKLRIIHNPESEYSKAAQASMGRKMDDIMIAATLGTVYTGKNGATPISLPDSQKYGSINGSGFSELNVETLRQLKFKFDSEEVDEMKRYIVCGASEIRAMLRETEITSADYNSVKALVSGELNSFMGFTFIRIERLPYTTAAITFDAATGEADNELSSLTWNVGLTDTGLSSTNKAWWIELEPLIDPPPTINASLISSGVEGAAGIPDFGKFTLPMPAHVAGQRLVYLIIGNTDMGSQPGGTNTWQQGVGEAPGYRTVSLGSYDNYFWQYGSVIAQQANEICRLNTSVGGASIDWTCITWVIDNPGTITLGHQFGSPTVLGQGIEFRESDVNSGSNTNIDSLGLFPSSEIGEYPLNMLVLSGGLATTNVRDAAGSNEVPVGYFDREVGNDPTTDDMIMVSHTYVYQVTDEDPLHYGDSPATVDEKHTDFTIWMWNITTIEVDDQLLIGVS